MGGENELEGFINSLYESNTPENADLLVMQIISTVYRITSAVSEKAELLALFSSNPIFARLTSYSSESVMKNAVSPALFVPLSEETARCCAIRWSRL